jgi:hypothetical protein
MGHLTFINRVVRLSSTTLTNVGAGYSSFKVIFESDITPKDFGMVTPDHKNIVRVNGEPIRLADKEYEYDLQIMTGISTESIDLANFSNGSAWVMSSPYVPGQLSTGNRTHRTTPGKLTNQLGLHRRSLNITGNIANKVTNVVFKNTNGGETTLWMPEEMRQFDYIRRVQDEEDILYSVYNRDANGNITTIDRETNLPVPSGAGVKEFIKAAGNHMYYTTVTLDMIENKINQLYSNREDGGPSNIVILTGAGGKRMFHRAIKNIAVNSQYYEALGMAEIKEMGMGMEFGKYFTAYRTIDGKVITVVEAGIFNKGARAKQDIANGRTLEGFPAESYNMVFLDFGTDTDSGESNVTMVKETGRELQTGIYRGMTPLPKEWGNVVGDLLSTDRDVASYEMMYSNGISIKQAQTSAWWELDYTK